MSITSKQSSNNKVSKAEQKNLISYIFFNILDSYLYRILLSIFILSLTIFLFSYSFSDTLKFSEKVGGGERLVSAQQETHISIASIDARKKEVSKTDNQQQKDDRSKNKLNIDKKIDNQIKKEYNDQGDVNSNDEAKPKKLVDSKQNKDSKAEPEQSSTSSAVNKKVDTKNSGEFEDYVKISGVVKKYPQVSKNMGEEGDVVVHLIVGSDGSIVNSHIVHSSGYKRLDKAALDTLRAAKFNIIREFDGTIEKNVTLSYRLLTSN